MKRSNTGRGEKDECKHEWEIPRHYRGWVELKCVKCGKEISAIPFTYGFSLSEEQWKSIRDKEWFCRECKRGDFFRYECRNCWYFNEKNKDHVFCIECEYFSSEWMRTHWRYRCKLERARPPRLSAEWGCSKGKKKEEKVVPPGPPAYEKGMPPFFEWIDGKLRKEESICGACGRKIARPETPLGDYDGFCLRCREEMEAYVTSNGE